MPRVQFGGSVGPFLGVELLEVKSLLLLATMGGAPAVFLLVTFEGSALELLIIGFVVTVIEISGYKLVVGVTGEVDVILIGKERVVFEGLGLIVSIGAVIVVLVVGSEVAVVRVVVVVVDVVVDGAVRKRHV